MDLNLNFETGVQSLRRVVERWREDGLSRLGVFRPTYPPLAVEVGEAGMTLVHVERDRKEGTSVRRYGPVALPPEALRMHSAKPNLSRPADVAVAIQETLAREEIEADGISLVLPDHLGRVSLIHLGERPASRKEALELVRWKLRKTVPFRVEDAHIDYQVFAAPGDGKGFTCLATVVLQSILDQYEELFRALGLHPGLIDLSTFNLANLYRPVLGELEEDAFLLNVTGSFFALMILRQGTPIFYRAKSYAFADDSARDPRQALVTREVGSSLAYYRERLLGVGPARVFLRCTDLDLDGVAGELQERLGVAIEAIDPSQVVKIVPRDADPKAHRRALQQIAPALGAALGREN